MVNENADQKTIEGAAKFFINNIFVPFIVDLMKGRDKMSLGYLLIEGTLGNVASVPKANGIFGKIVIEFKINGVGTADKFSDLVQMQGKALKVTLSDPQLNLYSNALEREVERQVSKIFEPEPGDRQSDMFNEQPLNTSQSESEEYDESDVQPEEPEQSNGLEDQETEETIAQDEVATDESLDEEPEAQEESESDSKLDDQQDDDFQPDEQQDEPDNPELDEPVEEVTDEDVTEWEATKKGSDNLPV